MSEQSPRLALPLIQPSQAQKHVTHNAALQRLDMAVQAAVAGFGAVAPPPAPVPGEMHALGTGATGAWAGQDGRLACWDGVAWIFLAPHPGFAAVSPAEGALRIWDGSTWSLPAAETQQLEGLGIGTGSDATNRLAVSAEATLLSHDGAGHQLKLNKAAAGDTASLLWQTGWSGRAEIGLAGNDDLSLKVSADGSTWSTAMTVQGDDGTVAMAAAEIGTLRLDGVALGAVQMTLADDSTGSVVPPRRGGFALLTTGGDSGVPQRDFSSFFFFDAGSSLLAQDNNGSAVVGQYVDLVTTPVTGTDGTDGKVTVAVLTNEVRIENRSGATRDFQLVFL